MKYQRMQMGVANYERTGWYGRDIIHWLSELKRYIAHCVWVIFGNDIPFNTLRSQHEHSVLRPDSSLND